MKWVLNKRDQRLSGKTTNKRLSGVWIPPIMAETSIWMWSCTMFVSKSRKVPSTWNTFRPKTNSRIWWPSRLDAWFFKDLWRESWTLKLWVCVKYLDKNSRNVWTDDTPVYCLVQIQCPFFSPFFLFARIHKIHFLTLKCMHVFCTYDPLFPFVARGNKMFCFWEWAVLILFVYLPYKEDMK